MKRSHVEAMKAEAMEKQAVSLEEVNRKLDLVLEHLGLKSKAPEAPATAEDAEPEDQAPEAPAKGKGKK